MTSLNSQMSFKVLIIEAVTFVLLNPLLPAICFFLWFTFRMSGNTKAAVHHHFLAKTMAGINGTFEVRMNLGSFIFIFVVVFIQYPYCNNKKRLHEAVPQPTKLNVIE